MDSMVVAASSSKYGGRTKLSTKSSENGNLPPPPLMKKLPKPPLKPKGARTPRSIRAREVGDGLNSPLDRPVISMDALLLSKAGQSGRVAKMIKKKSRVTGKGGNDAPHIADMPVFSSKNRSPRQLDTADDELVTNGDSEEFEIDPLELVIVSDDEPKDLESPLNELSSKLSSAEASYKTSATVAESLGGRLRNRSGIVSSLGKSYSSILEQLRDLELLSAGNELDIAFDDLGGILPGDNDEVEDGTEERKEGREEITISVDDLARAEAAIGASEASVKSGERVGEEGDQKQQQPVNEFLTRMKERREMRKQRMAERSGKYYNTEGTELSSPSVVEHSSGGEFSSSADGTTEEEGGVAMKGILNMSRRRRGTVGRGTGVKNSSSKKGGSSS